MKKIYLLLAVSAVFIAPSKYLFGQLSISPNPVFEDGVMPEDFEGIGHSFITNGFDFNLVLTWSLTVVEMTPGWQVAVCDVNQCYLPTVTMMDFSLGAGEDGTMDVHVYPNNFEGQAIIEVEVYQSNDSTNTTSATYFFNHTVGLAEKLSEAIKVYPNPTQDFISIDNSKNFVSSVELYNVTGKMVLSTSLNGSNRISIQELAAGNYILKLVDASSKIVSTNLIVKQ
ncbi:T9SS type A sorting domain-containing protein [Cryomorpha ignava]|uniref:T9SS type A sorting domain-containing protein n=1 Tax=Cryomorpha ignava TaxID=101383 RepID=A0A7K3WJU1_9FLAO|nr:T9SS type A sorting domain-containing protein [Cryomorpha ignava]NEN21886.1 T9SS type A sorting domain-containing protein [Cryomorpha ignava]